MKKALIAGAASAVLAAMPVIGVFATGPIEGSPIVDEFAITVSDACTFSRKATETLGESDEGHPAATTTGMTASGNGWADASVASETTINGVPVAAGSDKDTFTATVVAGNTYNSFAKSAFNVTCNNAVGGYKVTAYAGNLAGASTNIAYNAGEYAASGSSYYFTSEISGTATAGSTVGTLPIVWQHEAYDSTDSDPAKLASDDFVVTYNLKVALDQAVDTYTGSVVYVLANL